MLYVCMYLCMEGSIHFCIHVCAYVCKEAYIRNPDMNEHRPLDDCACTYAYTQTPNQVRCGGGAQVVVYMHVYILVHTCVYVHYVCIYLL